jgi:hypothetical protein
MFSPQELKITLARHRGWLSSTDAGIKESCAKATWRRSLPYSFEGIIRRIAFDWTTAYGLHPFRALFLIAVIWFLCIPAYTYSMLNNLGKVDQVSGIYQVLETICRWSTRCQVPPQPHPNSSSSPFASFRSGVSNPSVNQP